MLKIVKNRFRLIRYGNCGGMYYLHDKKTGDRSSLETKDKDRANELLVAHNEAPRGPAFNLKKARVYTAAADPEVATRTWRKALRTLVTAKRAGSANRRRWETFQKDKALKSILDLAILETRADQLLSVLNCRKVSTNVDLRRLQNFCIGMN